MLIFTDIITALGLINCECGVPCQTISSFCRLLMIDGPLGFKQQLLACWHCNLPEDNDETKMMKHSFKKDMNFCQCVYVEKVSIFCKPNTHIKQVHWLVV